MFHCLGEQAFACPVQGIGCMVPGLFQKVFILSSGVMLKIRLFFNISLD